MNKKTFAEYKDNKKNKQSKMRQVRNYLKSTNINNLEDNYSDKKESSKYRSGSRRREPAKQILLYKMMIRSRKNKIKKIGDRKYKLKN